MTTSVSMERLEQLAIEVAKFWTLYKLGVFTIAEVLVEINARREELGYQPLTEEQQAKLIKRGIGLIVRGEL